MTVSKERKKVLHIINGEFFAGAERVQDVLALCLPDYGYEVGFACLKLLQFSKCRKSTVPLFAIPMKSKFDLIPAKEIARIVRKEGYTLIHTHTPRAALIGRIAAWLSGVPFVHHVHSPTTRDTENFFRNRVNAFVERVSLMGVSQLIPVSKSLENYLKQQGWLPEKITMVSNGVVTPGPLSDRSVPQSEWIIGSVALFRPRKGIEILIQALAVLRQNNHAVHLRAVGPFETPTYENVIKTLAVRLGVADMIDWVGFVQDVDLELRKMDILVLPSLFGEGMPMVILEAMAAGVPVVASDVEGIPEVLEHGLTGIVVKPGDADSLASALLDLMNNKYDWRILRTNAYHSQVEKFSDSSMAKGVAKIYDAVLAN